MTMESLPVEMLDQIFSYLDLDELFRIERTCLRWLEVICDRYYQPFLQLQDSHVKEHLVRYGWREKESNPPRLVSLLFCQIFKRLGDYWNDGKFSVRVDRELVDLRRDGELMNNDLVGNDEDITVVDLVANDKKVYMVYKNSMVDVRTIENFTLIKQLREGTTLHDDGLCSLALKGRTLIVQCSVGSLRIYSTDDDSIVGIIDQSSGLEHIVSYSLSERHLALTAGWKLTYMKINVYNPQAIPDQPGNTVVDFFEDNQFENNLNSHEIYINNRWVVTKACRIYQQNGEVDLPMGTDREMFLHIRPILDDGHVGTILRPDRSKLDRMYSDVTTVCLSDGDGDYMAWSCIYEIGFHTYIFDLNSGDAVRRMVNSHFLGMIQVPIQFVGDNFFMKMIPGNEGVTEYAVQIAVMNMREKEHVVSVIPNISFRTEKINLCLSTTKFVGVHSNIIVDSRRSRSNEERVTLQRADGFNFDESNFRVLERDVNLSFRYCTKGLVYDFFEACLQDSKEEIREILGEVKVQDCPSTDEVKVQDCQDPKPSTSTMNH